MLSPKKSLVLSLITVATAVAAQASTSKNAENYIAHAREYEQGLVRLDGPAAA